MSAQDFLVELGTEELPPKALATLGDAFLAGIEKGLQAAGLNYTGKSVYAAPRRLACDRLAQCLRVAAQCLRDPDAHGYPVPVSDLAALDVQGDVAHHLPLAERAGDVLDAKAGRMRGFGRGLRRGGVMDVEG